MYIQTIYLDQVWEIRHKVFWPDKPLDFIKMELDSEGIHLGLFDNTLISVVSIFKEGKDMQFRKLGTLNEFQGKGYGTILMNHVLEFAKKEGMNRLWCNARIAKKGFYEKLGMRETGQFFTRDEVDFTIMEILF